MQPFASAKGGSAEIGPRDDVLDNITRDSASEGSSARPTKTNFGDSWAYDSARDCGPILLVGFSSDHSKR
jgi:hypothetical protein